MPRKFSRFAKRMHANRLRMEQMNKPFYLNLTAMADMFTIILVFLLVSYSITDASLSPPADVRLPVSSSAKVPQISVKISVSPNQIVVEDRAVASLSLGQLRSQDVQGLVIFPVFRELKLVTEAKMELEKQDPSKVFHRKIVLHADRSIPFHTIKRVLFTAGQAEYESFEFVVLRKATGISD